MEPVPVVPDEAEYAKAYWAFLRKEDHRPNPEFFGVSSDMARVIENQCEIWRKYHASPD